MEFRFCPDRQAGSNNVFVDGHYRLLTEFFPVAVDSAEVLARHCRSNKQGVSWNRLREELMKTQMTVYAAVLSLGAVAHATEHTALTGIVTDTHGKPLNDATVLVYEAGVRTGYNLYCPSCYTDCGKRTITDTAGHYSIGGLSRDLRFELLVVKSGFSPVLVKQVDPLAGPAPTATLQVRTPIDDPRRVVRGQVVDEEGMPVGDAVVETEGILLAPGDQLNGRLTEPGTTIYGKVGDLDSVAVTDHDGNFEIAYTQPGEKLALMVKPRAFAPNFVILPFGAERHKVKVIDGAVVRGRLMENGRPVPDAEIGLRPQHPWFGRGNLQITGSSYDELRFGTRKDGTFAITSVPAPEQWILFAKMESLASKGATEPVAIWTEGNREDVNLGDVLVRPGYRLRGQVVLSDGSAVANGMRASIAYDQTQDVQTMVLPADGRFTFEGLAPGKYTVWASVKGYRAEQDTDMVVTRDVDGVVLKLDAVGTHAVSH
jgi:protocatechuate 3,4-dioxygenase beta subunit